MFRIRRISDGFATANARTLAEVEEIFLSHFAAARRESMTGLAQKLETPSPGMAPLLFVAEDAARHVRGAALAYRFSNPRFLYLDYLAVRRQGGGGGTGGALYHRLREVCAEQEMTGLFFECLPADPALCRLSPEVLEENRRRLQFYARFGAYPVLGTAYETPATAADVCPPHLMYDPCGRTSPLGRDETRRVVRAILEIKYAGICTPSYVEAVVTSIVDDPVRLAAPARRAQARAVETLGRALPIVVNDQHDIFHVRERGYVEAPARISLILAGLEASVPLARAPVMQFPERHVTAVHDRALVDFIRRCSEAMPPGESTYPYVFPIRNRERPPKDLPLLAGYFCIDTFTPINANAWRAARRGVDCALTAASLVLGGRRFAYALVRPPGHHAERRAFGGFCYLNNAAIAAQFLSAYGRVAVLDVDYHHGNGTQEIFWSRNDVLTLSIHGDPAIAYPYFSGFASETGEGEGLGFNVNYPLKEAATPEDFFRALRAATRRIADFKPQHLVVALGFDTAAADPTGTWKLRQADFVAVGEMIADLDCPTVFVQEGGYRTRTLGRNAGAFFSGIWNHGTGRRR